MSSRVVKGKYIMSEHTKGRSRAGKPQSSRASLLLQHNPIVLGTLVILCAVISVSGLCAVPHCSAPEVRGGGQPSFDPSYECYDEGTTQVNVTCDGYLFGPSSVETCFDGYWLTATKPTCEMSNCSSAAAPTEGSVDEPGNTALYDEIKYSCNHDGFLEGPSMAWCQGTGDWFPAHTPTCSGYCVPPNVVRGNVTLLDDEEEDNLHEGDQIVITCDEGYTLTGPSSITCHAEDWSPDVGECLAKCVPPIIPDSNYEDSQDAIDHGEYILVTCNDNLTSGSGSSITEPLTCNDSTWDGNVTCYENAEPTGSPYKEGVIAGISILSIPLVLSMALNVILFVLWRRGKSDSRANQPGLNCRTVISAPIEDRPYEMIECGTGNKPNTTYTELNNAYKAEIPIIPARDVTFFTKLDNYIGSGDYGEVWKGEVCSTKGPTLVAIRQIQENASTSMRLVVETLTSWNVHSNIVKCIGYCEEKQSILYEFMSGGTLLTHLQSIIEPHKSRVDEASMANLAWQIAKGMEFLASEKIVHGNLCAHNVLLTASKLCKISDYGLLSLSSTRKNKPTRWSSIEMLQNGACTLEGDVWSFGIVVWEIVTLGAMPYPNMNFSRVKQEVTNGYKMPRPRHCAKELYAMMMKCWNNSPEMRPNFSQLLQELEECMEQIHDYIFLDEIESGS